MLISSSVAHEGLVGGVGGGEEASLSASLSLRVMESQMPAPPTMADGVCQGRNGNSLAHRDGLAQLPRQDFVSSLTTCLKPDGPSICRKAVEFGQGTKTDFIPFRLRGLTCLAGARQVQENIPAMS